MKKGGGVALYIKDTLQSAEYDELNSKRCKGLWCKIYGNKGKNFVVGVCYRSQEADDNEVDQLFECFKLASIDNHRLLIMGDFNYPDINWNLLRSDNARQKFLNW